MVVLRSQFSGIYIVGVVVDQLVSLVHSVSTARIFLPDLWIFYEGFIRGHRRIHAPVTRKYTALSCTTLWGSVHLGA